ncbi:MAG: amidohydrolase family protein [Gemmatimonadota bacterium]
MVRSSLRPPHGRGLLSLALLLLVGTAPLLAQTNPAPDRRSDEGEGPFERLIIRGATVIDGTGSPPRGPMDIVIEGNRIVEIRSVGYPLLPIDESRRPQGATREIDAHGSYVMPGFIDLHMHTGGSPKNPDAEYVYKLWLAHGITTAVGVQFNEHSWTLSEQARSDANEIVAPRIVNYQRPGQGWDRGPVRTPEEGREWVRWAAANGVQGVKFVAMRPPVMEAILDEARAHNLGSVAHLEQMGVQRMNALDAARLGLTRLTHFYGIFEALYKGNQVQPFPFQYNYNDEQFRFGQVARQWNLIHERGSPEWNALIQEFLEHDFVLDPTMTAYLASRDVMRARNADWHESYTLPSLWDFYTPSRENHGSYFFDWTLEDEIAWMHFYRVWMDFLNDYKNAGGRVTVSSDAGFIYNLYGFSSIEEMELLQEAGFHPLEVIRGATLHAAEALFEPWGEEIQFGEIREGLLADLVIIDENPIENLKVLYGTGHMRLNDDTGQLEWVGGINYTIKDGIVYDAKQLLADVAEMVEAQKRERGMAGVDLRSRR